jgi:hypothetical protein
LNAGGAHHSFELQRANQRNRSRKRIAQSRKKRREMPQSTGNKGLAEQIRKILGKHYANKYRAG